MPQNRILEKMLDRLFASLTRGPGLNCRPHSSRQRIDVCDLASFGDIQPTQLLTDLLGPEHASRASAKVAMPAELIRDKPFGPSHTKKDEPQTPEVRAWRAQQSLLSKLRHLGDDAKTYEQDTGVHALNVGYPVLSMPPGSAGGTRRILAPIAFIPLSMEVNVGRRPGFEVTCRGQGVDMVEPNPALFAWLERETGKQLGDIFADDEGEQPWREIADLIAWVAEALELDAAAYSALSDPQQLQLTDIPLAKDLSGSPALLTSAVLGLFPMSNQGLLRDMREMIESDAIEGPVQSFIDVTANLDVADHTVPDADEPVIIKPRQVEAQRNVALADPCQARTVELSRTSTGLVMHGPPGTGKSQTITNIIGDHLARGERVLFVCDKRTALDVVANRLEHLGLGPFCALVHDPQRDQRDLYMSIRARLEELPQVKTHPRADSTLQKIDKELQAIHDELTATHRALMIGDGEQQSFHERIGKWLSLDSGGFEAVNDPKLQNASPHTVEEHDRDIQTILDRASSIGYASSPWPQCIGTTLDNFLSRPMDELRRQFASCLENARAADATRYEAIPPFGSDDLAQQAAVRAAAIAKLQWVKDHADQAVRQRIAAIDPANAERYLQLIESVAVHREVLTQGILDPELVMTVRTTPPTMADLNSSIVTLATYLAKGSKWYAFALIGLKRDTSRVTTMYGLQRTAEQAQRLHDFLVVVRARYVINNLIAQLTGAEAGDPFGDDDRLAGTIEAFDVGLQTRRIAAQDSEVAKRLATAWTDDDAMVQLIEGLERSPARAEAVTQWEASAADLSLFDPKWLDLARQAVRGGKGAGDTMNLLQSRFDDIESVLRVRDGLRNLPDALRSATRSLVQDGATSEEGLNVLLKGALAGELQKRIAADPQLSRLDDQRLNTSFARYSELENKKRDVVTQSIVHQWVQKQKKRLLVGTGSRLNSDGADLRRRLFVRGKRAMRLRQVIASGRKIEGGDPLFDICPIWMASPETVAQVFPRETLFDLVVFDEASQCKLEEALPVLTRAKRVVIAGDPKQLPPSRFFEAAVTTSEDEALETDQDLFEAQQGEVEDLLGAALNLQIQESYLDVHYRSRNADLIQFSNEQFYHSRLQAIPGHPANRTRYPPLTIHTANGLYVDRTNEIEAREVGRIVKELLRRAEPPSIGIACFNISQRDLIADVLDEMANEDDDFARRLAIARERRGDGSFEGLFIKNLENVQGDERDHIIISTTYGPNAEGKFYRRFGPLGNAGGGRRLNVLVTRARHEVHLVTSIPQQVYRTVDSVPEGMHPSGGWLLFAYLRYAELLAEAYAENDRILAGAQVSESAQVFEKPIQPASAFARALAMQLKDNRNISSDVHWGNAGFCVDAALHHPNKPEDVTVGLLCDFTRFTHAPDAVEWEVFRTGILQWQGWQLHRVWSPQYFRDAQRVENGIEQEAQRVAEATMDDLAS